MKKGGGGERKRRRRWSEKGGVIYHCLLSAGLPSSLQASAKWNRKDKAGARKKKIKKIKERETTPTGPEGTQSCTPTPVTRGGMKENVIVINVPTLP